MPEHFETKVVHAGVEPDPTTGAIMTPIFQTSTYVQSSPGKHTGYEYSRTKNPTRNALENSIAQLEGGKFGLALGSGCAATDLVLHLLDAGDEIISVDDVYGGTGRLFRTVWARHGVKTTFLDMSRHALKEALNEKTKLIWVESPTNPMLKIIDIKKVVDEAKASGTEPLVVVDNTFASPAFQQPLALGADIVLHSTTKYINGHSDVVGGALVTNNEELANRMYHIQNSAGMVTSPFDSFLVLRGIKTLAIRMERAEKSATEIADFLVEHPQVESVIYPGLKSHPGHDVAAKQMSGFGGMITFFIKGNLENARRLLENFKIFALAESLGGVESLVEHPAIMTHASVPPETRKQLGISDTLVRLSVGIENVDDLKQDLDHALNSAG